MTGAESTEPESSHQSRALSEQRMRPSFSEPVVKDTRALAKCRREVLEIVFEDFGSGDLPCYRA